MSRIKITRLKEWYNRKFNYAIVADGKEILQLANGQGQVIDLEGSKTLQAKIMWCGSNKLKLDQNLGSNSEIKVSANKLIHRFISFAPVLLLISVVLSNLFAGSKIAGFLTLMIFEMMFSCIMLLTFWRNKWLWIEVTEKP
ncbi:hypothetical protein GVN16_00915 [Emticicia sp. CRIBPO]|uniref:hypothetical protein n=1 Tax=Emticicia sp. CRIBPO TaxID=2683258 RepID=UPI001413556F|nr:hypothetical protein [Emticicia sp. CRIBPO]NBA84299.1 hypothetical protein [Emticicia sp. CRIBPO]